MKNALKMLGFTFATLSPGLASAVSSAELYTAESYGYGRFEARVQYAPGDGVVSSFFMWKDGSEQTGMFWNELDFEKLGADCRMETNPIFGKPPANHSKKHTLSLDMCGAFHTYVYEWTPDAIVWFIDGMEIRRETGATPAAFVENAAGGMQIHFNLWPGDASFGGNFSPTILPVHEYVDWVQFSKWEAGEFKLAWREDFDGATVPSGWLTGSWESPKGKSTHKPENVNFINGYAVLSLTADEALGPAGATPGGTPVTGGAPSTGGTGSGTAGAGGAPGAAGTVGASGSATGAAGTPPAAGGTGTASNGNAAPVATGCSVGGPASGGLSAWVVALAALWRGRQRRRPASGRS